MKWVIGRRSLLVGLGVLALVVTPWSAALAAGSPPVKALTAPYLMILPFISNGASSSMASPAGDFIPDDPMLAQQWNLAKVNAPRAWASERGSSSILVAILDTGVDLAHPDLAGKLRLDLATNLVTPGSPPADDNGHGTHTSGIAAAIPDNGIGVAGMGGMAGLLPVKVLDASGSGSFATLAVAIQYAADHGARVISMSLGSPAASNDICGTQFPYLQAAVDYAFNKGVLLVAAAGNDGSSGWVAPADCAHVLGVASTDGSDAASIFSNHGSYVSVAAPGGVSSGQGILSTCWTGMAGASGSAYCDLEGTSMSAPLVAGLAALIYAHNPTYTPSQVASAILDNAVDLGARGWDPIYGCGRMDAAAALANGAKGQAPVCLSASSTWPAGVTVAAQPPAGRMSAFSIASQDCIPGRLVVRLQEGISPVDEQSILSTGGASEAARLPGGYLVVQAAIGQEAAVAARLARDRRVVFAQPDYRMTIK